MTIFIFFLLFLFGIFIPLLLAFYAIFCVVGDLKGAPYVPTSNKLLKEILDKAKLKKGQNFLELGSGDGRVIRLAVKDYQVHAVGIEIHPLLVLYSNLICYFKGIKNCQSVQGDLFKVGVKNADAIFLFLLPETLVRLKVRLEECKKGTMIISHGFAIAGFEKYLSFVTKRKLFPTFYYIKK